MNFLSFDIKLFKTFMDLIIFQMYKNLEFFGK